MIGFRERNQQGSLLAVSLVITGLALLLAYFWHPYTLYVDGQAHSVQAIASTPRQLYARLGIPILPEDRLSLSADESSLVLPSRLDLQRARPVRLVTPDGEEFLQTAERFPANILLSLGIKPFPKDILLRDGEAIDLSLPLPPGRSELLVWQPARQIALEIDGRGMDIFTQQRTLGAALEEQGIIPGASDSLSPSPNCPVSDGMHVQLHRARTLRVDLPGSSTEILSAQQSLAGALHEAGLSPQGLDEVGADMAADLSASGSISLKRVDERLEFTREETPYQNSYVEDPEGELDTLSVLEAGQLGIVVNRTRSQMAGGETLASQSEGPWKASDPVDGVLGMGTIPVLKKAVVDGEEIEYWRKVSVYATGYMPSALGGDDHTASGLKLTKGIIAVTVPWYRAMKFQQVYVQGYGYGTIADTGGGIPGRPWIDLGFDDHNYVSWHHWTTMYFLAPIPAWVPLSLP